MTYSDIPSAQLLVLHFKAKGIKNIVISPGSRNAPLILSFSKDSFFTCFSIVDERCAAFFALGMAQQLHEPVAVVCTSGSALLNYYPAVAEAYYSEIPLVVVSADRPSYKIDIGDGQTIRQPNILDAHIGFAANLKLDVSHATETIRKFDKSLLSESQQQVTSFNAKAITHATEKVFSGRLPVHINIPFEEPLYGQAKDTIVDVPILEEQPKNETLIDIDYFVEIWSKSARKMILIGVQSPQVLDKAVLEMLAADTNTMVFTETTSNVQHEAFFPSIDSIVAPIEKSEDKEPLFDALRPDILITLGGLIVSKKIKAFLRDKKPKYHWHVGPTKAYNTFFCLSDHINIDANTFFKSLPLTNKSDGYRVFWDGVKQKYLERRQEYLEKTSFSDFWAFYQIQKSFPNQYQVHLANSSTVRYSQLFNMNETLQVYCNRGASGIDGSTSTAIGASIYYEHPTTLITGDLSFFYDSNALWFDQIRNDFRIILINNSGGGIFRILPGSEDTKEFATYFETKHDLNAQNLAQMYGFSYYVASTKQELLEQLNEFYAPSEAPKILEIFTPRTENDKILLEYFDFIS